MLNHTDCARRDEALLLDAMKFVPEKQKLTNLIDVLLRVQNKLVQHGVENLKEFLSNFEVKGIPSGVLTQAELTLLQQVQERRHSIEYYSTRLEENIGKELSLYETISQQISDLVKNRYAIIGLIRHYGGSVTSLFDRLISATTPLMEHLSLRHSILVPDLFVVLQNQKRQLRNKQWSKFKRLTNQEKSIMRRLSRQINLVNTDLNDIRNWHPPLLNEKYCKQFFEEERVSIKLVLLLILIESFIAKTQGHM